MAWDEALFGWFYRAAKKLRTPTVAPEIVARRAHLSDHIDRLRIIAAAVAQRPVVVRESADVGGVSDGVISLPGALHFALTPELNQEAYVLRTVLASLAIREGLLPQAECSLEETQQQSLALVERACALLEEELPSFAEARQRVLPSFDGPVHPLLGLARWVPREAALGAQGASDLTELPRGTELKMRPVDHVKQKTLGDERDENPLVHSFEKLHTLEEHKGGRKRADGSDELDAHAEALEELQITEVIRSNERAESLMRSDAMFESGAGEVGDVASEEGLPYDEWNAPQQAFRRAWCRVRVARVSERVEHAKASRMILQRAHAYAAQVDATRSSILTVQATRRPRARQFDGADIDEDAMVERHACLLAGSTPPDRLYVARRRHAPSLAVLLLLDASLSTDGWIEGQRVLDVERDATLILGEALEGLIDEFGVASFYSQTRRDCRFEVVKGMREPWVASRGLLESLQPNGYTRIGPALRHATTVLARTEARRRLLLVVTDGKPNDYDRYEGSYGVQDVQHAVLEAHAEGVLVHGLAIDPSARIHLPRMFGLGGFTLLRHANELARAMGTVVARMER